MASSETEPARLDNPVAASREAKGTSLLRALSNTGISVVYCDRDLRVIWSENLPPVWSRVDVEGLCFTDFLPQAMAADLADAKLRLMETGVSQRLDVSLPGREGSSWFSVWIDSDQNGAGEFQGIVATAVDITDQRRREQTLRTLLREVAHRSKNLLAIIQSMATQTGRHAGSVEGFLTRFRGRLQSLASTQDLVTSSNWRGADLHELLIGQVARYTTDPKRSIRFEGERPYLNPNAALHVGLALHELAVNSVSYGALARPDGHITVNTHLSDDPPPALSLVWTEAISIGDQEIGQKRFGSVALERVVPASVNGTSTLELSSERLTYTLRIPPGNFEID